MQLILVTVVHAVVCYILQQSLGQKSCHKLEEQLMSSQQESERLQEELQNILQQLDANIR